MSRNRMRKCRQCSGRYETALGHPVLGSVCPMCMCPTGGSALWPRHGEMSKRDRVRRMRAVVIRDGWICHLCGHTVDPNGVGPQAPTLDHMVPRSAGGSHKITNLKLAHAHCNHARGNQPLARAGETTP